MSFDIKFTRQGFENACWHREGCRAIQHAFSKPSLVNLISKDANPVFYLSVYPFLNTLQTSDNDVILMFVLIQRHKRRHSKSATSSWPDKGNMPWDRKRLLGYVEPIQFILGVTDKYKYSSYSHRKNTMSEQVYFHWLATCSKNQRHRKLLYSRDLVSTFCIDPWSEWTTFWRWNGNTLLANRCSLSAIYEAWTNKTKSLLYSVNISHFKASKTKTNGDSNWKYYRKNLQVLRTNSYTGSQ